MFTLSFRKSYNFNREAFNLEAKDDEMILSGYVEIVRL